MLRILEWVLKKLEHIMYYLPLSKPEPDTIHVMWEFRIFGSYQEMPDFTATFTRVGITTEKKRAQFIYGVYIYIYVYEAVSYPWL